MRTKIHFQLQGSDNPLKIMAVLLVLCSTAIRIVLLPHSNLDLYTFNLPWYQTLIDQGIGDALATNFSNYNPPYTYLLALATLTHRFLAPIIAIKLIPIAFDILGAVYVYKIVRLKYAQGDAPFLAAGVYFIAPTVMVNSTYWGQADSLYVSMLLICLHSIMIGKPARSLLAFGMAFAFKAQAVFFLPFLGVMIIQKRISWKYAVLIPIVYLAAIAPVLLSGRPLMDTLLIYVTQSKANNSLSMNAPNLYYLLPGDWYSVLMPAGIVLSIVLILYWVVTSAQRAGALVNDNLPLYALISVAISPFLLPKMHDRYFYPADVLSIVLAFYQPQLWFVPILYQLISFLSISVFLFNGSPDYVILAALLNTFTIAFLLRTQGQTGLKPAVSAVFSWVTSILIPVFLLGASLSLLLTHTFFRIEYDMPYMPANAQGYSNYERFQRASRIVDLVGTRRGIPFLSRLKFSDGKRMFTDAEQRDVIRMKQGIDDSLSIEGISILGLFSLSLIAWITDSLAVFRKGVARGGRLTIAVAVGVALFSLIWLASNSANPVVQLFPLRVWQDAALFVSGLAVVSGYLLKKGVDILITDGEERS